jgi:hypothetical protein
MPLGLGVYGTLGPDEIGAKLGLHVVRQEKTFTPSACRCPGGASNDLTPNLQDPANPLPLMGVTKRVSMSR